MTVYRPYCLSLNTDAEGAVVNVGDILNMALLQNPDMAADLVAHANTPLHVAMKSIKPVLSGETFAIKTFLDNVATKGGKPIATTSNPGVYAYFQKFDDNGNPVSGSNHRSLLFKGGVLIPKTISIDHQGDARLRFDLVPVKYSSNAIVTIADNAALPTISDGTSVRWTLGPVTIGNVALSEYTGLEIDFGNTVQSRGSQSDVYDTHIEIRTHEPTIRLTGIDPAWFSSSGVPLEGIAAVYATDDIFLRKRTQDEDHFVANGTAEHVKITFNGLAAVDQAIRGEAQRITETSLMIKLAADGSGNNPLTINTASAIS